MNAITNLLSQSQQIETKLGYTFKDKNLLVLAFTHCSFVNENKHITPSHNERLEFLGDSVLSIIISEHLYRNMPSIPEGDLSYLRARLVEAQSCVTYIQDLQLEEYLLLGRGERMNDGRGRESILADLFEAIIGAIYLDGGLKCVETFIFEHFAKHIQAIIKKPHKNWKAELQDYSQKRYQQQPEYHVLDTIGPDHDKTFKIAVSINDEVIGTGKGSSKKTAQQAAAANALEKLTHD